MEKKVKILVISSGEFSGIKASLVSALKRKGHDVIDVNNTLRTLRFRHLYRLFIVINALLVYKTQFRRLSGRTYASYYARSQSNKVLVDKHHGIDVVILIGANSLNFWRHKQPGILYTIFTDHTNLLSKTLPDYGFQAPERQVSGAWNKIEQVILSQQDHIFVMGSHVKCSMIGDYGIRPDKITVVGGGPNLDVDIEADGVNKTYSGRRILFVGLDAGRKGLDVLEKAFLKVTTAFPDVTLHVVGVDGISANGVTYHGTIYGEPLKKLFYESQIFAVPTFREPFGIVFLEAMWSKNVCIGTNIEAIPEIIADGENGFLVEPGDHESLAERMIPLFADEKAMYRMGERGYELAKSKWTWEISVEKMIEQLESMLYR